MILNAIQTATPDVVLQLDNVSVWYTSEESAVTNVSAEIHDHEITAIIGPSGCSKSTLLRAINRVHKLYPGICTDGRILLQGGNILEKDPTVVRRMVGMVFQQPNPFSTMSITNNMMAGYKLNGIKVSKAQREEIPTSSLQPVGLWEEVKDRLDKRGFFLPGGQQQRLCIAHALALRSRLPLMDEPTSALDLIAINRIEELILKLKKKIAILIVTHNMGQAARISDRSMFMYLGELVEYNRTGKMFINPSDQRTEDYLQGNFGQNVATQICRTDRHIIK